MKFTSIPDMADFIARKHTEFNGHACSIRANARAFDTLARAVDFLRNNPSAASVNFDAICNPVHFGGMAIHTEITISLDNDGFVFSESVIELYGSIPGAIIPRKCEGC